jgi:hypothetical protein
MQVFYLTLIGEFLMCVRFISNFCAGMLMAAVASAAFAQGARKVTASSYTEECEAGNVRTMVFVSNSCTCDATVNVNIEGGGMDILLVKGSGGSKHDMIGACGRKALTFTYSVDMSCPAAKDVKAPSTPTQPSGKSLSNQSGTSEVSPSDDMAKRLEAAKNRNSAMDATNGKAQTDFDNKIDVDRNATINARDRELAAARADVAAREAKDRANREKIRKESEADTNNRETWQGCIQQYRGYGHSLEAAQAECREEFREEGRQ